MTKRFGSISRALVLLLAILLLSSTVLTACTSNDAPGETTAPEGGESTLGPADSGADTSTSDEPFVPSDSLIGDGVETAGVFPTFSKKGGLYTETRFTVAIKAPEGYTVRYTTDGSVPTKKSKVCENKIAVKQSVGEATVIRAACFDASGKLSGQVITHTYVSVENTESLTYTVMLSTDEENLDAMYANVQAKVERAAHAEIIAPDGTRVISQDVGLRLFGGSSRGLAQKSFKIIARKDGYFGDEPYVGAGTFTYPFFPERVVLAGKNAGQVLTKYDGLILRNGGNDSLLHSSVNPMDAALIRDGLANEFVARYATNVGASLSHYAVVYLNGEYYGILELRENQNEDYVKRLWGVDDNDVVVVKSELNTAIACDEHAGEGGGGCRFCGSWFFYETDEEDAAQAELKDWIALCKKAADAVDANETTYRKVYEEVASKLDLTNVKEYLAMSCFFTNTDWPHNNVRVWRYTGAAMDGVSITDGKWRFATRDMDLGIARYTDGPTPELDSGAEIDMFAWVLGNYVKGYGGTPYNDALYLQGLFAFLLRDDTFRAEFADYCRLLCSDEAQADLLAIYDTAYQQVKPLIEDHIDRWSAYIGSGFTTRHWTKAAGRVKNFITKRPDYFLKQLDQLLAQY